MQKTYNLRVRAMERLVSPHTLKEELPMSDEDIAAVLASRQDAEAILAGRDSRMLVVVGPCSIHDPKGAMDYAQRLVVLHRELKDVFYIVMRAYFEKPRTTIGWKGLISDPYLNDSNDIEAGLRISRKLLIDITRLGLPTASEFLDPIVPQYNADMVTWAAVGARTTESQTHRMMASGLSMPVGFKNGTDGSLQVAVDAISSARHEHSFLGLEQDGMTAIIHTTGNPTCHAVLRGGRKGTNYDVASIAEAAEQLKKAGLPIGLMVDCSHANCHKDAARQEIVWDDLIQQRLKKSSPALVGVMVESNLFAGNQPMNTPDKLKYGVSITDPCLDWETTEAMLRRGADILRKG
jgi:3-deoxy-7-phosphoheptulonate synthase